MLMGLPCRDSKAEIPNLVLALSVENVGRLNISMQIAFFIDIDVSLNDLPDNLNSLIVLELFFRFK